MLGWTTACPDWESRILDRKSLVPFDPLFQIEAAAAAEVFGSLSIVDAPGSPLIRDACRQWVFDFCNAVFGAYDAETGRRLIREFFLCVAKKNSKSTIAAGVMLTALIRNWRMSAEFLILAPTIEVANNSFYPARDMVRNDPELDDLFHVQEHYRTITHRQTKATLKVVAADDYAVGGKKAVGVLVDELWLFGKRPNAENMLREATGGLASRPEGFVIYLSTQSDEPPAGVFKQKLMYARGVRDGRIQDKRFLPLIYEFPQHLIDTGTDRDKANFYIPNPNLGASVDEEFLEREYDKAIEAGPTSLAGFLAKHLNVEIGLNLRSDRWAGADHWQAAADGALTLDDLLDRCEVVVVGIDGGGLDDLLGLAVMGREKITRRWLVWSHAWAHETVLERRKDIAPRLRDFAKQGDLTICQGIGQDVEEIADIIERIGQTGLMPEKASIGVDPSGITEIVDELTRRGFSNEIDGAIVGVKQGWTLTNTIKTTERQLAGKNLIHGGSEMMNWAVGNCKVEARGNAIVITKQVSGSAKIDPVMALFDAAFLMALNPETGQFSADNIRFI
ncbi:MAG TPA: terminase TerL endonuclease subunit [Terriglobia bacterium]|nr:terminase TerL endonuclease subunit [Terriglobia bacterium]